MGLSYAYWTGQLEIRTSLSTGLINPIFIKDNVRIDVVRDDSPGQENGNNSSDGTEGLKVGFLDDHTMFITGQIEEGYTAFIHYSIANDGTLPIKYDHSILKQSVTLAASDDGALSSAGDETWSKAQMNQQAQILAPQEKIYSVQGNGKPYVQIQVSNEQGGQNINNATNEADTKVQDVRTFELHLPFDQWTR